MSSTEGRSAVARYALAYLLWLITLALGLLAAAVAREGYMVLLAVNGADRYFAQATHNFLVLFLAIAVLILTVFAEHHYRTGVPKERLAVRFFRVAAIVVGSIAALHTLRLLLLWQVSGASSFDEIVVVGEWLATGILIWLWRRFGAQPAR